MVFLFLLSYVSCSLFSELSCFARQDCSVPNVKENEKGRRLLPSYRSAMMVIVHCALFHRSLDVLTAFMV